MYTFRQRFSAERSSGSGNSPVVTHLLTPSTDPALNLNLDALLRCTFLYVAITLTSKTLLVRLVRERWYGSRYPYHRRRV